VGDSSSETEKSQEREAGTCKSEGKDQPSSRPAQGVEAEERGHRFTLHDDQGKALSGVKVKVRLASGEVIAATTMAMDTSTSTTSRRAPTPSKFPAPGTGAHQYIELKWRIPRAIPSPARRAPSRSATDGDRGDDRRQG